MTLHEAIEKLLHQNKRSMTTTEIASELNKNNWYQKKDGSTIEPFQIHGRTKNYPQLFIRNGSTVSLHGQPNIKVAIPLNQNAKPTIEPKRKKKSIDYSQLETVLMNEKSFKIASIIDNLVPNNPGFYCIRIDDINQLPKPFDNIIKERKHNIIYIGIASQSLSKRFLNQELRAKGHGTFFRSIGAVLGFRPIKGSLINKANKRNYTFSTDDENKIVAWINSKLLVNWVEFSGDFESIETNIIQNYLPLFNLAKNPAALTQLSDLRADCVRIANS
jgi:hypothetical protein